MNLKKLGNTVLFPHISVTIILTLAAGLFLVYSTLYLSSESAPAIASYTLSCYALTLWSVKIPYLIRAVKAFKRKNKYARLWQSNAALRVNISLYGTFIWNTAYGTFQLGLAFKHNSIWFYSLADYYISLAVMRLFLLKHLGKHKPGEEIAEEIKIYRICGIIFLIMNITLSLMIFFMIYQSKTFHHHEITTIAMATYTFTTFTTAIVNILKYRKYNNYIFSASKAISLASACVSMLTLEATMLTTFDNGTMTLLTRRLFLGSSGGAISLFIISTSVYMIIKSTKKLKKI